MYVFTYSPNREFLPVYTYRMPQMDSSCSTLNMRVF